MAGSCKHSCKRKSSGTSLGSWGLGQAVNVNTTAGEGCLLGIESLSMKLPARNIDQLANSWVNVAGPQRGQESTAVCENAQFLSHHGRPKNLAPGHRDCANSGDRAVCAACSIARDMARDRRVHLEAIRQNY